MRAILKHLVLLAVLALTACGGDDEWDLRMSFVASPAVLTTGGWVTLDWSSYNTSFCTAEEGWDGTRTASGSERIWLDGGGRRIFRLTCSDGDRIVVSTVEVLVTPS